MLTEWKGCEVIELDVQADHVHLVVSGPPVRHPEREISDQTFQELPPAQEETLLGQPSLRRPGSGHEAILSIRWASMNRAAGADHIRRYVKYQEGEDRKEESHNTGFDLFEPPTE